MRTYSLELEGNGQTMYLIAKLEEGTFNKFYTEVFPTYNQKLKEERGLEFNGRIFDAPSDGNSKKIIISPLLPKKSTYISNIIKSRVDELVETILTLRSQLKGKEKELVEHLKGMPCDEDIGDEYGAFYDYTLSSRPSYKSLFERVLSSLENAHIFLRWWTRRVIANAHLWLEQEQEEHPSANRSLVVFTLDKREEKLARRA